jgi:hypothetical protein
MDCKNHAGVPAVTRCAGCAEPFCSNCLVDIKGQKFCGSCKVMALQGRPAAFQVATKTCKEAKDALIMAIVGLFCFGIILEPLALVKASKARKAMQADPTLSGGGMATAATVIAVIGLVLWVIGIIIRVSAVRNM